MDPTNTVLLVDGANWHNNAAVKKYLQDYGLTVMKLPPSSSVLNPIELCWAAFKRKLATALAKKTHQ